MRITEQNVRDAVDTLNSMLPQHEVIFGHRYDYYALDYRLRGTTTVSGTIITCATKRECYDIAWAMIKGIELAQSTAYSFPVYGENSEKD